MSTCNNLPELIELNEYNGDWPEYENALYNIFREAFIDNTQIFMGKPVGIFTDKMYNNKEKTFWHVISEGPSEFERNPDMRRCERITWIEKIINLLICKDCDNIYKWKYKQSNGKYRYKIWCRQTEFIVILEERKNAFMLITAYIVKYNHAKQKLEKEYNKAIKI